MKSCEMHGNFWWFGSIGILVCTRKGQEKKCLVAFHCAKIFHQFRTEVDNNTVINEKYKRQKISNSSQSYASQVL